MASGRTNLSKNSRPPCGTDKSKERFRRVIGVAPLSSTIILWMAIGAGFPASGASRMVVYSRSVLEASVEQWQSRDGALGGELSDYFCEAVVENPDVFLQVMAERRRVFDEWLSMVETLSFKDLGGCVDRECLRGLMMASLRSRKPEAGVQAIDRLLRETIEKIRVRKLE